MLNDITSEPIIIWVSKGVAGALRRVGTGSGVHYLDRVHSAQSTGVQPLTPAGAQLSGAVLGPILPIGGAREQYPSGDHIFENGLIQIKKKMLIIFSYFRYWGLSRNFFAFTNFLALYPISQMRNGTSFRVDSLIPTVYFK